MTTALLKQALEAIEELRYSASTFKAQEMSQAAITAIRTYLTQEEALQRMVDTSQEFGLYDTTNALKPTYAGRAVTTTVTDHLSTTPVLECGWVRAADEEMVSAHIGVANLSDSYASAKAKLSSLIDWHIAVATDPAVNGGFSLQPTYAGRAVTTTITDPAEIRRVFEIDDAEYPPPESGFAKL